MEDHKENGLQEDESRTMEELEYTAYCDDAIENDKEK